MRSNFYCINVCSGGKDFRVNGEFSIDKWNQVSEELEKLEVPEDERTNILFPPHCETQCNECINVVLDTQSKNRGK